MLTNLNENYYLRKCYLKQGQVPTQSVMMAKMSPPLAKVYFQSMTPKLKVLAGLEPPMKGGGSDWYMPPAELLRSRAVLKPVKKECLSKLGIDGIILLGEQLVEAQRKQMAEEKRLMVLENDMKWKRDIETACRQVWDNKSREESRGNTAKIRQAFHEFTILFMSSINTIEGLLMNASIKEIERIKAEAHSKMSKQYETLLKRQATMLYDRYAARISEEKERRKNKFVEKLECARKSLGDRLHDINVEKHIAIEKLRCLLESQNLACQIYVALKEREECKKEMKLSKHEHQKQMKVLNEQITLKNFEIRLAQKKENKRQEFNHIWLKKICHVVKRFQDFVGYCLNALPEHAEFFINMEKLMLLQLNEAMENPSVESIFVSEENEFYTPIPRPRPFYLFCDEGLKAHVNQSLCPKHCTSSASQLPVIVINKNYIYTACDSFELFTGKMKQFIDGHRGNDDDFHDDHEYSEDFPVKYTQSQQCNEIKMQSSISQILQKEFSNVKELPIECCLRKVPFCFCSAAHPSRSSIQEQTKRQSRKIISEKSVILSPGEETSRDIELEHEREPKWDSYFQFVKPTRCKCPKTAKKHLDEHMPPYMRNMSAFDTPDLPHYEPCSLQTLKKLVSKARGIRPPEPVPEKAESKTKDISTQYSDQEFDFLCTCLSEDEVNRFYRQLIKEPNLYTTERHFHVIEGSPSRSLVQKDPKSFTVERAKSLKHLLIDSPELQEIFKKKDCNF